MTTCEMVIMMLVIEIIAEVMIVVISNKYRNK